MKASLSRRALGATLFAPALARAEDAWPSRTITLVVPYPPGGSTDTVARPVAQEWGRILGQAVVVENRGGAGGSIGADIVARARPDGYTLLLFPTAIFTISPHMMRLPYDVNRDFTPIARVAASDALVVMHPSVPVRTMQEFVAYAKAHPGEIRFGSAGNGTITQMQCEIFAEAAGIQIEHIPYRGSGPSLTDLLAGRTQLICDPVALPAVRDGRLIPLATFGERRHPEFPAVPTLMELGLAERGAMSWFGVAAPAGTPPAIVSRIAETLGEAVKPETVTRALAVGGLWPAFETGEAFANRLRRDREIFGAIVRRTGAGIN